MSLDHKSEIEERNETDSAGGLLIKRKQKAFVGGVEYERDSQERPSERPNQYDLENQHFSRDAKDYKDPSPDIVCGECLGSSFSLIIRGYSVEAKCKACGKTAEVYSG